MTFLFGGAIKDEQRSRGGEQKKQSEEENGFTNAGSALQMCHFLQ